MTVLRLHMFYSSFHLYIRSSRFIFRFKSEKMKKREHGREEARQKKVFFLYKRFLLMISVKQLTTSDARPRPAPALSSVRRSALPLLALHENVFRLLSIDFRPLYLFSWRFHGRNLSPPALPSARPLLGLALRTLLSARSRVQTSPAAASEMSTSPSRENRFPTFPLAIRVT